MFESLKETIKSFSFQTVLKGNILTSPGSFGSSGGINGLNGAKSNSPASNMVSNKFLSTYYSKMTEINDYELNDLTSTIIGIYQDYLLSYINKESDLISINAQVENYEDIQAKINKVMYDLDVVGEVKRHLWDIIFHGAWCFRIGFNQETRSYEKKYLPNPHNVVNVYKDNVLDSYLAVSEKGKIYQMKPGTIFRLGAPNLTLINDINPTFLKTKTEEDTLIKSDHMSAGSPLFYNITGKIKEYLLKEQILALLSIKDLIQPLLLLIQLDKSTSVDEGNRLALNVENMINKYSDISSIISSNFGINSLIDALMNNIRVIPDYHSGMGNMNNIDLSKVTEKLNTIEQSQDTKKDIIMNTCCIPRALYSGESTKWDAIKSSQRLNSRIHSYAVGISDSIRDEALFITKDMTGVELSPSDVTVNLFKKTDVDYNQSISGMEILSTVMQGISTILTNCQQTIQEIRIIDPGKYAKYILDQLKLIDPTISEFMSEESIRMGLQQSQQQE